jgi:hypothetical protein
MSRSAPSEEKVLPLTVHNTSFLLDRLGQDCHPLQFLRELTQNSIEAILNTGRHGEIRWDVDWNAYEIHGAKKLCIIDNGAGMTGNEMVQYINQLSSSIHEQSMGGNYGVGAKIAAAPRNHTGMVYFSWKNGDSSMINFYREPKSGDYGLRRYERTDGSYHHILTIDDDIKPNIIKENGTMVVLLGIDDSEDTIEPPLGTPAASRWIAKYLNTRYFEIPDMVTIKVREGWNYPKEDTKHNKLRTITGQQKYLNKHSESKGVVELDEALAHWWILEDTKSMTQESNYFNSSGHMSALYNNELYEITSGRASGAKLQQFGVIFGHKFTVIYIEPKPEEANTLTTNTARTHLLLNNSGLPWHDWAAQFRDSMPDEIKELIKKKAPGADNKDHLSSIRDRLKSVLDLFKLSRYRPTASGSIEIDDAFISGGNRPLSQRQRTSNILSDAPPAGPKKGTISGNVYALFEKKNGVTGEIVKPDPFPDVFWISIKDGSREPQDMEDRAARYLKEVNTLHINRDFRVFRDMIDYWVSKLPHDAGVEQVVTDIVEAWFEQALVETIIGVNALRQSREWSDADIDLSLSEEALTTAVMQRYHVHNNIKRELGSRLGKISAVTAQVK